MKDEGRGCEKHKIRKNNMRRSIANESSNGIHYEENEHRMEESRETEREAGSDLFVSIPPRIL